jgi:hypothetical protein
MRPLVQWLVTREAVLAIAVGVAGPVLWTTFESQLVYYIHDPISQWLFGEAREPRSAYRLFWRGNQLVYGLLSAALFALPLSLAFRRDRFRYGVAFVTAFVLSLLAGMWWAGGGHNIPLVLSLPETWAVVLGSLAIFWFMNRRHTGTLPSNGAFLTDTYASPLRAQRGAAKRGR